MIQIAEELIKKFEVDETLNTLKSCIAIVKDNYVETHDGFKIVGGIWLTTTKEESIKDSTMLPRMKFITKLKHLLLSKRNMKGKFILANQISCLDKRGHYKGMKRQDL